MPIEAHGGAFVTTAAWLNLPSSVSTDGPVGVSDGEPLDVTHITTTMITTQAARKHKSPKNFNKVLLEQKFEKNYYNLYLMKLTSLVHTNQWIYSNGINI